MDATSGKKLMSGYNVYRVTEGDNYLIVTCVGNNDSYVRYKLTKDTRMLKNGRIINFCKTV